MGRKRTGHVERRGDKFFARLGREHLGSWESDARAWAIIEAAMRRDKERDVDSFGVRGEKYMQGEELLARERRGNSRVFQKEWSLWDRHIRGSKLYHMRIKDIRREHVQKMLDEIVGSEALALRHCPTTGEMKTVKTGKKIGERTATRVRSRLSHFFDSCLDLTGNPASRCKIKNAKRIKRRVDGDRKPHLHADEVERLFALEEMTVEHRAVYALCIYAGLRVNEVWGLRWENVIRLGGSDPELHVQYSYDSLTKTEGSQREIPMLPQLVAEVRAYRASLPSAPLSGVVFSGEAAGGCRSPGSNARWTDKRRRLDGELGVRVGYRTLAKIRAHLNFMHMRHTCATHLLAGTWTNGHEWPIEKVSEMLGHDSVETTIAHYAARQSSRLHREVARGLQLAPKASK